MSAVIMIQGLLLLPVKLSLPLPCAGCWQRQAGVLLLCAQTIGADAEPAAGQPWPVTVSAGRSSRCDARGGNESAAFTAADGKLLPPYRGS